MKTRTVYILSLTAVLTLAAGSAFGKYSGGTGEPNTPYQIASKADLLALAADANDYGKCFILTADINMAGQVFTTAIIAPNASSGNDFHGTYFTGTFDGNDHKITNFTINGGSNSFVGLFGYISSGSVKNLGIEGCSVSGHYYAGGLAGFNNGSISNCYSTGLVSGVSYIGGLAGCNSGTISDCYSTGTVTGGDNSSDLGGLVGFNNSMGNITNCYTAGLVSGSDIASGLVGVNVGNITNCYSTCAVSGVFDADYIGGLVGMNYNSINNCYSTGVVSGCEYVGGLVAYNLDIISNCHSTGSVSGCAGASYAGGLVGYNYGGSAVSSFWDVNTSGQSTSAGGTGKTTAQMKTLSTFTSANWDFVYAWGIGNGQTYPYLKLFNGFNPADLNYDGKVDLADFAIFAANWLSGE
jgi:The GLUG motif